MIVDPFKLQSIPLSRKTKHLLPNCTGIYFVISASNKILYIGKSINISNRWNQGHHRSSLITKFPNIRLAWFEVEQIESLTELETQLIERFNPPFNGNDRLKPLSNPISLSIRLPVSKAAILDEIPDKDLEKLFVSWIVRGIDNIFY